MERDDLIGLVPKGAVYGVFKDGKYVEKSRTYGWMDDRCLDVCHAGLKETGLRSIMWTRLGRLGNACPCIQDPRYEKPRTISQVAFLAWFISEGSPWHSALKLNQSNVDFVLKHGLFIDGREHKWLAYGAVIASRLPFESFQIMDDWYKAVKKGIDPVAALVATLSKTDLYGHNPICTGPAYGYECVDRLMKRDPYEGSGSANGCWNGNFDGGRLRTDLLPHDKVSRWAKDDCIALAKRIHDDYEGTYSRTWGPALSLDVRKGWARGAARVRQRQS